MLIATPDVNDAFKKATYRVDPDKEPTNVCYTTAVGDLVEVDPRFTFGRTDSPGNFVVMASARGALSHCKSPLQDRAALCTALARGSIKMTSEDVNIVCRPLGKLEMPDASATRR